MTTWTAKDVERWMVVAERADPRVRNPGEERPLRWPERYIESPEVRRVLKLWIWCEANGYAFFAVCGRRGLAHTTALRRKNEAVDRIVMLLNLEASLVRSEHLVATADGILSVDSG